MGSCAAPSAKGDDKFITTDYLQQCHNELLRSNAKVIDISTLKEVQDTLIQTVGDVVKIQREGAIKLRETEKQVLAMRENLRTRLTQKGVDHGA
ncbi:toxic anion resistance protein [Enterobacter hormaechei]|uniref:toxic anion resistance protein n=1 Tax=Enterobacter hormaechei TaxID=158836 RepID=UPI003EBD99C8